jgi:hypothetical protein
LVSYIDVTSANVYPPLNTERPLVAISAPVTAGNQVKVDFTITLYGTAIDLYLFNSYIRLYRDGVRLMDRDLRYSGTVANSGGSNISYIVSQTYVDTAPATTTSTYEVRVIIQYVSNVTFMSSGYYNNISLLII